MALLPLQISQENIGDLRCARPQDSSPCLVFHCYVLWSCIWRNLTLADC